MKLRRRNTARVIDHRGQRSGGASRFPGLGGLGGGTGGSGLQLPMGKGGGIGLILVIVLFAVCIAPKLLGGGGALGGDIFSGMNPAPGDTGGALDPASDPDRKLFLFVNDVTADLEETWAGIFQGTDRTFRPADLVVFTGSTPTGCGTGTSATGPFYCPADEKIYLDLGFFKELRDRFGAPGDFAQAYVIAHEYGHHIQTLLGINGEVQRLSQEDPGRANDLSIRLELQADCLAGVWGHSVFEQGELESGDLEEGLAAAAAVGDDRIQESTTGRIDQESWTHGSSEQRARWFRMGFDSGNPDDCDTFDTDV
jgi:predicted metalloprotease